MKIVLLMTAAVVFLTTLSVVALASAPKLESWGKSQIYTAPQEVFPAVGIHIVVEANDVTAPPSYLYVRVAKLMFPGGWIKDPIFRSVRIEIGGGRLHFPDDFDCASTVMPGKYVCSFFKPGDIMPLNVGLAFELKETIVAGRRRIAVASVRKGLNAENLGGYHAMIFPDVRLGRGRRNTQTDVMILGSNNGCWTIQSERPDAIYFPGSDWLVFGQGGGFAQSTAFRIGSFMYVVKHGDKPVNRLAASGFSLYVDAKAIYADCRRTVPDD